jgi:DNA repair protein RadA/Sms
MAKFKKTYSCTECGTLSHQWNGQCGDCGAWNTLTEIVLNTTPSVARGYAAETEINVIAMNEIAILPETRVCTGLIEFDRVLGGGLVSGSIVLLGGDPGIGKSTVLLQIVAHLSAQLSTLYVTGEESLQQIKLRAQRLGVAEAELRLLAETQIERILSIAAQEKPRVLIIDSIQTVYTDVIPAAPGAVSQVRESTAQLVRFAKQTGTAIFLAGHVTKEGVLAGPRVLEHMVDTVLYFEGDMNSRFRILRAVKNRFGAVNELGIFAMTDRGLKEVSNPSAIFLSRYSEPAAGSVVMVMWEGSRPMLIEVQALVDDSPLANPRRVTVGLDPNRLALGLAVLHRHGGVAMYQQDVFVNIVGGIRITETAADLAVVLAVLSSYRDKPLPMDLVVFGEVGLAGEIRPVQSGEARLKEAAKHGFKRAIVAQANVPKHSIEGMEVIGVQRLQEALNFC